MKQQHKKIVTFVLRWGIAVVGIWYVLSKISWRDQVLAIVTPANVPQQATLAAPAEEGDATFKIYDPNTGQIRTLPRTDIVNERDVKRVVVDGVPRSLLGLDLSIAGKEKTVNRLLVATDDSATRGQWVTPDHAPSYHLDVPHPRVQIGVHRMLTTAELDFLIAAIFVFPVTYLVTSYRWHALLKALDIELSLPRTFVLNMVGSFYNTFMPGSTGGDLLKAYYVAKQTHHRTRAVMSVLVDRAIGLLALVMLGGAMAAVAAFDYHVPRTGRVAAFSLLICVGAAAGVVIFYTPSFRRLSGLEFILDRLPMQKQVRAVVHTMEILGRRPWLMLWSLVVSFPVHVTVIVSALCAGLAFHLPIRPFFYWTCVPVIVLAGSIPVSPQGAGVMEFFAIKMLEPQGVTVAQAFALTMSIRLVQILWNLSGGLFVLRGGFHAPTESEQRQVDDDDDDDDDDDEPEPAAAGAAPRVALDR